MPDGDRSQQPETEPRMQPAAVQVTNIVGPGDANLVREARAGDVRAFEAIAEAALPGAFRLASAILGDETEAADATRNALVAAWRELPRLGEVAGFEPWFHRILVNECRMRARRRPQVGEASSAPQPGTVAGPVPCASARAAVALDRGEVIDLLDGAFEELDPEDRAMLAMHHLEDRPLIEIAACLHMPVGTAKWRLYEAREALQRALDTTL